jgi:hypothetical protein
VTGARAAWITICGLIAVVSLAVAVQAARYAHSEAARGPTAAEEGVAAVTAIGQRWERLPLGDIFPASFRYSSDLGTTETARWLGIGADDSCSGALDRTLQQAAQQFGCEAALRASYADELGGTVYTVGVLAFPGEEAARAFADSVPQGEYPATGLRALALPGTAAALFTDQARQYSLIRVTGPYVVLAVAGYADGRPAAAGTQKRDSVFLPAGQLVTAVVGPLAAPQQVHCGTPEFAC